MKNHRFDKQVPLAQQIPVLSLVISLFYFATALLCTCLQAQLVEANTPSTAQLAADGQAPPALLSASSLNGTEIGICFSTPMKADGLIKPASYQVLSDGVTIVVRSVFQWSDSTSVVLRLSKRISGSFTVSAQGLQDLAGNPISSASVNGKVWGPTLSLVDLGNPGLSSQLFTCSDGHITMRGAGGPCYGCPSNLGRSEELV